ncbi:TPA: cell filamentation protein Fic [Legionella pneumophila subsp. pneumophila]|nr:Fic family protein [Legionella pneumophila]HAT8940569.1 cell filamentation protein Fic [Legionella pneumophila subsp. pneumophila]RYW91588.1 Fic family protein [Legionella pneumophila]HAT2038333.1 Fic family protein [Legionella pneumophila]HAT9032090.1 cell filamentation protein Fic [Legionella pneumophila subsp. pneumophila]
MMKPSEKLAESLEVLHNLQKQGKYAIRSKDISRTHRERLVENAFLEEVVKGWYVPIKPDEQKGESTAWYASFWSFCASYLNERFGDEWCLSPEQSLLLHSENWTVPKQLMIRSPNGTNRNMELPHNTALFSVQYKMPAAQDIEIKQDMRIYAIVPALLYCSPKFFSQYPTEARSVLSMFNSASDLLHYLLEEGHSWIAGRICGALQNIGKSHIAEEIKKTMESAGYQIREEDPFLTNTPIDFSATYKPAYRSRLEVMWHDMRDTVRENFPKPRLTTIDIKKYIEQVDEKYISDAYHSLSIEGYQVSPDLIEKVRSGQWNPDATEQDRNHRSALAARGYWQAFQAVKKSLMEILNGDNPGKIIQKEHGDWYRELFQPSVAVGLLKPTDLAGYRRSPVFIRQSKHIPPRWQILSELMEEFFQLITQEKEPSVRVVLGHFFFVYIHPYSDGNGRIGRFLMNLMLASGHYPWTIIPVERRNEYMEALEQASVHQNILPFTKFIASCI